MRAYRGKLCKIRKKDLKKLKKLQKNFSKAQNSADMVRKVLHLGLYGAIISILRHKEWRE